jgi:hypothetical protein
MPLYLCLALIREQVGLELDRGVIMDAYLEPFHKLGLAKWRRPISGYLGAAFGPPFAQLRTSRWRPCRACQFLPRNCSPHASL